MRRALTFVGDCDRKSTARISSKQPVAAGERFGRPCVGRATTSRRHHRYCRRPSHPLRYCDAAAAIWVVRTSTSSAAGQREQGSAVFALRVSRMGSPVRRVPVVRRTTRCRPWVIRLGWWRAPWRCRVDCCIRSRPCESSGLIWLTKKLYLYSANLPIWVYAPIVTFQILGN